MSNKLRKCIVPQSKNTKQIMGYLLDIVLVVDLVLLSLSGFFISNKVVTIKSGSSWWKIHYITSGMFVCTSCFDSYHSTR